MKAMNSTNHPRWEIWCEQFLALPKIPMDSERSLYLTKLLMVEDQLELQLTKQDDQTTKAIKDIKTNVLFRIATAHATRIGLKCNKSVLLMICALVNTISTSVMYVHALRKYQITHNISNFTMMHLCEAFPIGFPTEDDLEAQWDRQKLSKEDRVDALDNFLDTVYG